MDHRPQAWGRPRDDIYGAYDASHLSAHFAPGFQHDSNSSNNGFKQATQSPAVTGTSVIALKFKDGVIIAADNLASYGSLARFDDVKRLRSFAGTTVVGFSGDVSDMQYLDRQLNELEIDEAYGAKNKDDEEEEEEDEEEENEEDEEPEEDVEPTAAPTPKQKKPHKGLNAANLHCYLSKLFYARRNKFDPLWNQILVAGFAPSTSPPTSPPTSTSSTTPPKSLSAPITYEPFLAAADLRGTTFSAPCLGTGYGAVLAVPIMRRYAATDADAAKLTREQAMGIIKECMKVLYYRDARSWDTYSWAVITREGGVEMKTDEKLEKQSWAFAERIKGYGTQTV